jgi:ribosomal protein S12 methylthiotransferase
MNVYIESLGCFKNKSDTERLANILTEHNIVIVDDPLICETIIINTCGFIRPAVEESIERILELSQYKKNGAKLIAFGCMIERYKNEINKIIPELDLAIGVNNFEELFRYLSTYDKNFSHKEKFGNHSYIHTNLPYYSFVKIADGCDNRCSYCTIPIIKGGLKSIEKKDIEVTVKKLINAGVKEINIIAQDITKYGIDIYGEYKLSDILEMIAKIDGDFFIRLLYLNPDGIDKNLITLLKNTQKIIKYLDIPIQHASDNILKRMNRKIDAYGLSKLFEEIRKELPEIFLRTTAIVGFPGESEHDFKTLLTFIDTFKPEWAGFFRFYPEEEAPAYKFNGRITKKIIDKRLNILENTQVHNVEQKFKRLSGKNIKVFIEAHLNKKKVISNCEYSYVGRSLLQAPEIDGKCYINIDNNIALNSFGPYNAKIKDFKYPDIFVTIS